LKAHKTNEGYVNFFQYESISSILVMSPYKVVEEEEEEEDS
jgi:hypothetical protein